MKIKEYRIFTKKGNREVTLATGKDRAGMIKLREQLQKKYYYLTIHIQDIWQQENTQ